MGIWWGISLQQRKPSHTHTHSYTSNWLKSEDQLLTVSRVTAMSIEQTNCTCENAKTLSKCIYFVIKLIVALQLVQWYVELLGFAMANCRINFHHAKCSTKCKWVWRDKISSCDLVHQQNKHLLLQIRRFSHRSYGALLPIPSTLNQMYSLWLSYNVNINPNTSLPRARCIIGSVLVRQKFQIVLRAATNPFRKSFQRNRKDCAQFSVATGIGDLASIRISFMRWNWRQNEIILLIFSDLESLIYLKCCFDWWRRYITNQNITRNKNPNSSIHCTCVQQKNIKKKKTFWVSIRIKKLLVQ